jgi:hypothetical protein
VKIETITASITKTNRKTIKIETPRGIVKKTKGGKVSLIWDKDFAPDWTETFLDSQKFIDNESLRLAVPYMPMQSGMLQKLGVLGTTIGSGEVVYLGPYARYLYYGKVMVGRAPKQLTSTDLVFHGGGGSPARGAFWFERMKADKKNQILRGAAKVAKKESK